MTGRSASSRQARYFDYEHEHDYERNLQPKLLGDIGWLLRFMRVLVAGVDLQLIDHMAPEHGMRQHAFDDATHCLGRIFSIWRPRGYAFSPPG